MVDAIYFIRAVVDLEASNYFSNNAENIHFQASGGPNLIAQQHAFRVHSGQAWDDGGALGPNGVDVNGANGAGGSQSWTMGGVWHRVNSGTVTTVSTGTIVRGTRYYNPTGVPITISIDISPAQGSTALTGLLKRRQWGIGYATTNTGDLDMTMISTSAQFNNLPSTWSTRLEPGESLLFAAGLPADPVITSIVLHS